MGVSALNIEMEAKLLAARGEQPRRRPHDLLARELGGSRHPRCYPIFKRGLITRFAVRRLFLARDLQFDHVCNQAMLVL